METHYLKLLKFKKNIINTSNTVKDKIHSSYKKGLLERLCSGQYTHKKFYESLLPWDKQLIKVMSYALNNNNLVLSHQSAARIHGFGVLYLEDHIHARTSCKQTTPQKVKIHNYKDPIDTVELLGMKLTHPAQTVLDCAKSLSYKEGLVIADSALSLGIDKDGLKQYLKPLEIIRGRRKINRILENATALSDSPGETECRVALEDIGMPDPELQFPIFARGKQYYADFAYPDFKLIVEFDGLIKYRGSGAEASKAVTQEKIREDSIKSLGWDVIRLITADIRDDMKLWDIFKPYLREKIAKNCLV